MTNLFKKLTKIFHSEPDYDKLIAFYREQITESQDGIKEYEYLIQQAELDKRKQQNGGTIK